MATGEGEQEKALQRQAVREAAPAPYVPVGGGPPGSVGAPPPAGSKFVPPSGYLGPVAPAELRGKARFDWLMQRAPNRIFDGVPAYEKFIQSLPDDPNDAEYSRLVSDAKRAGETGIAGDVKNKILDVLPKPVTLVKGTLPKPGDPNYNPLKTGGPPKPGEPDLKQSADTAAALAATGVTPANAGDEATLLQEQKHQAGVQRAVADWEQPVFKGGPVRGDLNNTETKDPFIDRYMSESGFTLPNGTRAQLQRGGNYAYMGTEANPNLNNAKHDVFMYAQDALNAFTGLPGELLSRYQAGLGLAVTGRPDPILQGYWDDAVKMSAQSVANGTPISVRELFDLNVSSKMAQLKGSGGGGGGSGLEKTPVDMAAVDYYRSMMSVLGDISGVAGG